MSNRKRKHLEVDVTCAESFLMTRKAAAQCQLSERPEKNKYLAHGNEPLRPSCSQC